MSDNKKYNIYLGKGERARECVERLKPLQMNFESNLEFVEALITFVPDIGWPPTNTNITKRKVSAPSTQPSSSKLLQLEKSLLKKIVIVDSKEPPKKISIVEDEIANTYTTATIQPSVPSSPANPFPWHEQAGCMFG